MQPIAKLTDITNLLDDIEPNSMKLLNLQTFSSKALP
jgi:hypothetical protein